MKTPLFPVGYSTFDINKVFLLRYPFVGGYWQEIEEDGLTPDIFYCTIKATGSQFMNTTPCITLTFLSWLAI
jgi:hypothetical protein